MFNVSGTELRSALEPWPGQRLDGHWTASTGVTILTTAKRPEYHDRSSSSYHPPSRDLLSCQMKIIIKVHKAIFFISKKNRANELSIMQNLYVKHSGFASNISYWQKKDSSNCDNSTRSHISLDDSTVVHKNAGKSKGALTIMITSNRSEICVSQTMNCTHFRLKWMLEPPLESSSNSRVVNCCFKIRPWFSGLRTPLCTNVVLSLCSRVRKVDGKSFTLCRWIQILFWAAWPLERTFT